jgi:cytosine/adenosine deaminase-related metal-dependent hydrolase
MSAREALEIATRGGADVLGRPECGRIAVGKRADIALWNVKGVESAGSWDPAALVLAGPSKVSHLIVEGREIVRDGLLITVDLNKLIAEQSKCVSRLQDRL